ncbi:hypothetical protein PYCC9005_000809 [Savitreella phatthalungensis]
MARSSGLLWKVPWRMSAPRKFRQRLRLRAVDDVITTLRAAANAESSGAAAACKSLARAEQEVLPESQMPSRDKYTVFARSADGYRKGVHKVPKFTKAPIPRVPPKGF